MERREVLEEGKKRKINKAEEEEDNGKGKQGRWGEKVDGQRTRRRERTK